MSDRKQELLDRFPWLRHQSIITDDMSEQRFDVPRGDAGCWLDGVKFDKVDFSGLDLEGFSASGSEFVECDFSGAKLKQNVNLGLIHFADGGGDQRPTIYRRCAFDRAALISSRGTPTVLGAARFEECSFARARISNWLLRNAEFVGCRFVGRLYACRFYGRDDRFHADQPLKRPTNEFVNNDFRNADQQATARAAIDLRFDFVDPRVQTTQRAAERPTHDVDARIAQMLFDALQTPDS